MPDPETKKPDLAPDLAPEHDPEPQTLPFEEELLDRCTRCLRLGGSCRELTDDAERKAA